MSTLEIIALFILSLLLFILLYFILKFIYNGIIIINKTYKDKHIFITGGSQGLGLSIALLLAKEGAKVTIASRNIQKLKTAKELIVSKLGSSVEGNIYYVAADVTHVSDIKNAVSLAVAKYGKISLLITSHGQATPRYFLESTLDENKFLMEVNYFGTLNTIKTVLPDMISNNEGHILCVSSQLSLCGFIGYSSYCPTKFAIRGLLEVLRNEFCNCNIQFSCAYPPNMDTPGFEVENLTKPKETKSIESFEKVYSSDHCAKHIINSLKKGENHIDCGDIGGYFLIKLSTGFTDRNSILSDMLLLPLISFVCSIYRMFWNYKVRSTQNHKTLLMDEYE